MSRQVDRDLPLPLFDSLFRFFSGESSSFRSANRQFQAGMGYSPNRQPGTVRYNLPYRTQSVNKNPQRIISFFVPYPKTLPNLCQFVKSVAKILIFLAFLQFFPEFLRPVNKKTSHNLGYTRAKHRVWVPRAWQMSSQNRAMSQIRD